MPASTLYFNFIDTRTSTSTAPASSRITATRITCPSSPRSMRDAILLECTLGGSLSGRLPCLGSSLGHAFPASAMIISHASAVGDSRLPCSSIYICLHPQEPTKSVALLSGLVSRRSPRGVPQSGSGSVSVRRVCRGSPTPRAQACGFRVCCLLAVYFIVIVIGMLHTTSTPLSLLCRMNQHRLCVSASKSA